MTVTPTARRREKEKVVGLSDGGERESEKGKFV